MKKNIIIGFHNPYLIIENRKLISKISKICNIYLITTNHYLTKKNNQTIIEFKRKKIIKDYIIFSKYFQNSHNLNLFSIILNYFMIKKKLKSLSEKKVHLTILGSNVFMWERIITEKIIDRNCKLLIYQPDMLTLPITSIKELYKNTSINKILSKIHKSRQLKGNKSMVYRKKINLMGFLNNKIDLFDRIILGKIFFKKKFGYRELDLNTWMDTKNTRIDYIFTYFKTLKIYWERIYPKVGVKLVSKENTCKCKSLKNKNKLLFLGDDIQFSENIRRNNFITLKRDLNIILSKTKNNIIQIDFKPHPASNNLDNLELMKFLKKEFKNLKINLLNKSISPEEISCNYMVATGAFGTGLFKIQQACNYCIVAGLTSQSKYYYIMNGEDGKNSWLKVKNTDIGVIKDDGSLLKNTFKIKKRKKYFITFFSQLKKQLA